MVVCHCLALNDRTIRELCTDGPVTVDDVVAQCGAGGRCGGCRPTIEALLAEHQGWRRRLNWSGPVRPPV
ncbi:MAG: (2Fe-2S)-binding protein [Candidatus Microthrix sp.]|nr:(2Fe-2S)-binding protein [Candidatus Microthrix sp.]